MKLIDISTPKFPNTFAMVDDEDFEWLNEHKWTAISNGRILYATRRLKAEKGCKRSLIFMHREVLMPDKGALVDHVNGNGLDNRKENLRPCTKAENARNAPSKISKYGFKGIAYVGASGRYQARIKVDGKVKNLGTFGSVIEAARAYNLGAIKYHGEFANLNEGV